MADAPSFAKLVPGFDFLQNLARNAGAAMPGIGQWVAPTLDPAEIEKRIQELKTVQFWLEQNVRMIGATIQALEVQRMTLTTLRTMNVQMADLRDSLTIRPPSSSAASSTAGGAASARPAPAPAAPPPVDAPTGGATSDAAAPSPRKRAAAGSASASPPARAAKAVGAVDPLQWWGALTQQFTELAASAMKDGAADAARAMGTLASGGASKGAAAAAEPAASGRAAAPREAKGAKAGAKTRAKAKKAPQP